MAATWRVHSGKNVSKFVFAIPANFSIFGLRPRYV